MFLQRSSLAMPSTQYTYIHYIHDHIHTRKYVCPHLFFAIYMLILIALPGPGRPLRRTHALGPRPDGPRLRHVLWRLRCRGAGAGAGGRAQHLGDALGPWGPRMVGTGGNQREEVINKKMGTRQQKM